MAEFKDSEGADWLVKITVGDLIAIKDRLGLDLADLAEKPDPSADLAALGRDMGRMVDVLYVLCERQCRDRGVTDEDFGRRLDLDAFGQAVAAFAGAFVDFFLKGPEKDRARQALARMAARTDRLAARERAKLLTALDSFASAGDSPGTSG